MATKALYQLFYGVNWGKLDVLIVDMPPGTGDIQLSMAKHVLVDGAILVTTPQEVALADVRKASDMFKKLGVPILGVVENMSYFEDPAGNRHAIFGEGGAKAFAKAEGLELLGQIPLIPVIREAGDRGEPEALECWDGVAAQL